MKVKMAFLSKPFDLKIQDVELGMPKGKQVLIKLKACGICGSDVEIYEGKSAEGRYDIAPFTPGHEWAGEITAIGEDVSEFQVGDLVTGDCVHHCGVCENCRNGLMPSACLNFKESGFHPGAPGGMGEYMVNDERYLYKLPKDMDPEIGAWVEPFSIAMFNLWGNGGCVSAYDDVVVFGAGPIGICATMIAKTANARTIMIDPLESRRDFALRYGADCAIDPTQESWKKQINDFTCGKGPSIIVEASGNDTAIASIWDIAAHSAQVRLTGHSAGRLIPVELGLTNWKTLNITGAGGTKDIGLKTIKFMSRIMDKFDFRGLISHRFKFQDIDKAIDVACYQKSNAMKVMLKFD
ncbi:MAG: alcohol dehydrogenase catalytic domain-containing protein [Oscillospiraceae bacterium]|nr:alcohol dehydrogenase catalytic domain-containing protein [Oscillospiraceae bacterium]